MDPSAHGRQPKQHRHALRTHNVTDVGAYRAKPTRSMSVCDSASPLYLIQCKNNYFILLKLTHSNINLHAKNGKWKIQHAPV